MKKTLIILSILVLLGAGYFTYDKWVKHSDLTTWSFVPSDAAIVFELDLIKDITDIQSYPVWKNLEPIKGPSKLNQTLSFLDSINGDGGFSAIFKQMPALISLHKVSSSSLDFLMILDIQNLSQNTFISAAIGQLKKAGYTFKTRTYNGFKISEVGNGKNTFTYIFYKNFFLSSFTSYLVEDAIRTIDDPAIVPFSESFPVSSNGKLHVNFKELGNLLGAFLTEKMDVPLASGSYQFAMDSAIVNVSGISQASEDWISTHTDSPGKFEITEVIPSNTAILYHITSTDFSTWKGNQAEFLKKTPEILQLRDSLKIAFDFDTEQVFDLVDDEIGLATLESGRPDEKKQLFILKVKNVQEAMNYFTQLTERIAYSRGDTVYAESYSENEIRFLPIQNFPRSVLGDLTNSFDRCFYINYRNYIIFSNSLQELKILVGSIQEEDTWGKSILMNEFLSTTNAESNVSLVVNVPRFWPELISQIKPEWKDHFSKNQEAYKKTELAAFQVSFLEDEYFTNITFSQSTKKSRPIAKTSADNAITLTSPIVSKPFLVRTHSHNFFDILMQDSTFNLYYFDRSFSSLWTTQLEEEIVSEIFPVDYYRNGKIQYAFATTGQIHIIDRTGSYIPGYPRGLPNSSVLDKFNLIDYDRSRNYRLGITDVDGKVYLADKNLKLLEGWDPIPYQRPAVQPLRHSRIGGRDVMISIQENGIINVTNRRGQKLSGFPFDLKAPLGNNYFLNTSNSLGRSSLTTISTQGELMEINLEGIIINRDQLIKTSSETTFQLVTDRGEKSFIIVRKEGNVYEILDTTGNLLFSKDYLSPDEILIQYYQFGAGKDLIVFTDTATKTLYIFDRSGNLVTGNPIKSSNEVSLVYSSSKKELQVYTTSGLNLELYQFDY
ncbi:MAG: hypothetical protein ABJG78_20215 [Cyclobacteriaceae bacterium]